MKELFDEVVFVEEHIYQKASEEGAIQGKALGMQQGYEFGMQQGDLVGKEIGQMQGFVDTISIFVNTTSQEDGSMQRLKKSIQQMQDLLLQFPKTKEQLMDSNSIPINELFEQLKNQYKLLHIRLRHAFKSTSTNVLASQDSQNNNTLDF